MDGVTVLNEFEVTTRSSDPNLVVFGVTILVTVIICAVFGFIIEKKRLSGLGLGMLTGLAMGVIFGMLTSMMFAHVSKETTTRYEVCIDDNVSMNEFLEHYTIIEQRGDIYVVEENNPQEQTVHID